MQWGEYFSLQCRECQLPSTTVVTNASLPPPAHLPLLIRSTSCTINSTSSPPPRPSSLRIREGKRKRRDPLLEVVVWALVKEVKAIKASVQLVQRQLAEREEEVAELRQEVHTLHTSLQQLDDQPGAPAGT